MQRRLEGRIALVTGAGAGIGRATAERLAHEGATVTVIDIDEQAALQTASRIRDAGGHAHSECADVADADQVQKAVTTAAARYGAIDIVVNDAGVAVGGSVTSLTLGDWQRVMDTNLRSVWLMLKFAIPLMQRGGSVVNMSSAQALMGFPGWAGYAATKGGIIALTQQAAVEYARRGIRINAVAPGTIMTPMNEKIFAEARDADALRKAWGDQHALGRFGTPEEVASVIAFLVSDDASFVTGVCIPVDGGMRVFGPTADPS